MLALAVAPVGAAVPPGAAAHSLPDTAPAVAPPPVLASNAFFYYEDLEEATRFYRDVLGVPVVADYGFARILRLAATSYLILVDADRGMHSASEPKTVTLSLVTDDLRAWRSRLLARAVEVVDASGGPVGGSGESLALEDPGGYTLELLRPGPDPTRLRDRLHAVQPRAFGEGDGAPGSPGVRATILWLVYDDPGTVLPFYREGVGLELLHSGPRGHLLQASPSGFLGLERSGVGLHVATDTVAVTASFWVGDVDGWFRHMRGVPGFEPRTPEIVEESGLVRVFVGYDPAGRFLEWDTFLAGEENAALLPLLYGDRPAPGRPIDPRSYKLGGIGAFAEMVSSGVKTLGLSDVMDPDEADALWSDAAAVARRNGVEIWRETEFLVTDLFPAEHTEGKHVFLLYRGETLERYLALKERKARLVADGRWEGTAREAVARAFGELLSYPRWRVDELLARGPDDPGSG